jgi:hypothetical protein
MVYSGMFRHVTLVRTDVSEKLSAPFIKVTSMGEKQHQLQLATDALCEEIPSEKVVFLRSVRRLLVTAGVVSSSPVHRF